MKKLHRTNRWVLFLMTTLFLIAAISSQAVSQSVSKRSLITQAIDESTLLTLRGNTHPDANAKNDRGQVSPDFPMEHMMLQLRRPTELEKSLEKFIDQLHDRKSPIFHQWMNAKEFGANYGLAQSDLDALTRWLESHGFTVNLVYPNNMVIDFSGNAAQVREAFHTEIHRLEVKGVKHIANMSDPQIPAALAPAVAGLVSLHDFRPESKPKPVVKTNYTSASAGYLLVPADLATIYNLNPLFSLGYTGQGQTIAVVELTNAYSHSDWDIFRSTFGLSGYTSGSFTTIHPASSGTNNCTDPGALPGAEGEAALDVEWASAAAPSAAIVLASCAETTATHGWFIALQNLLNGSSQPPAIVSMSYGVSETELGAAANAAIYSTYQQAVTAGVSIFVSTGDATAVNNDRNQPWAIYGINMNGFATTPYNVAVGGTDFSDQFSNTISQYWSPTNGTYYGSALSYIPEIPWNGSCGSTVMAAFLGFPTTYGQYGFCNSAEATLGALNTDGGAGGPSGCATGAPSTPGVVSGTCAGYAKPSWQSIVGNPSDGVRDIPDVSLFASAGVWGHAYVFCMSDTANGGSLCTGTPDTWSSGGGTSFAAPIMAGIQALANQATGARWGNPNPMYYYLASSQYGTSGNSNCNSSLGNTVSANCIFYDITLGDIDVPCEGSVNCYTPSGAIGVLSTSDSSYQPAFATHVGWDFPTGIGSLNAYNLVAGIYNNTYFQLAVSVGGTGSGTVTSNPVGITCPGTCANYFKIASKVTLTATPASGSTFAGWSGACTGTGTCTVTMNGFQSVAATFNTSAGVPLTVTLSGTGNGSVTSNPAGINCPGTCSASFPSGSSVVLTANAASGSTFSGWSGACTGTGSCSVTMRAAQSVTATFSLASGNPVVSLSSSNLTLAGQLLTTTSASKSVTLTNTGTAPLTISAMLASGNYGGSHNCPLSPSTLAPNASCTINLNFTPTIAGSIAGEITISDNAAGSPHLINLTGTGLTSVSMSPASVAFGTVMVGTTSAAKTVTLTNNLSSALNLTLVTSNGYSAVGSGTNPCGSTLAGRAKCTMDVTFSPTSNGTIQGAMQVTCNAALSPQDLQLSGTGSGGASSPLSFSPANMSFTQFVGTTGSKALTVTNISTAAVNIASISASGNFQAAATGSTPCGGSLAAGAKCTLAVSFSPSINATIKGAVAIAVGSGNSQFYNVTGSGVLALTSSAAALSFPAQAVGTTSAPQTVTLTNQQSSTLNLVIAASGQYAVTTSGSTPCGTTLAAGAKCTFNVTFSPAAAGTIKGVVTLGFGVNPSPIEIKLTGTGQ